MTETAEELGNGVVVCRSEMHTFGTDAFLLSAFSRPKAKETLLCDLGTGCGIIPFLWARAGFLGKIWGIDIQKEAIEQCISGIEKSKLNCEITPLLADFRKLPDVLPRGKFSLVSCNPPYQKAKSGVLSRTAASRAARHETLCDISDVCKAASELLKFGGRFCLCCRPARLSDVICAMRKNNVEPKRLRFVIKKSGEKPKLFLLEGRKGAKPFLTVEPSLILYENGKMTPEFQGVYQQ